MFFGNLKLRPKLLLFGLLLTLVPLLILGVIQVYMGKQVVKTAGEESLLLAKSDLDHTAMGVYRMCEAQNELLMKDLNGFLNISRKELNALGGVSFAKETVGWEAFNQFSQKSIPIELPRMQVGGRWLGQTTRFDVEVPVVDVVKIMSNDATCTLFQRMNAEGDMLRVATSVAKNDGTRAIGTYIPAINPDGKPNPVANAVLKGESYIGRAFVVNRWYLTMYEPIFDSEKNVRGMLYVGIPQESARALRQAIYDIKVGTTGYVYVLDGKGNYVISQFGKRDGEDISKSLDSDGNLFIKEMVDKSVVLKPGKFAEHWYMWLNPGDPAPRAKVARTVYFEPWDWVIGASSYADEFQEGALKIERAGQRATYQLLAVVVVSAVVAVLIWILVSNAISGPILDITKAVTSVTKTKDLTQQVPVHSHDEVGIMAREFNNMLTALRQAFMLVEDASGHVNAQASEVARRAAANRQRAENEEKQISVIQDTVAQMGETAGEVQNSSTEQAQAASNSYTSMEALIVTMKDINEASGEQIQEASIATERVASMGETAGKVSATAQRQGQQVGQVTESMRLIAKSVDEMTRAADRATEHGRMVLNAAQEGRSTIDATVQGMQAIRESSEQIADITGVITDIAEQTNLLALNAAIEAARAGVHGRGFAVVADEVGKLAQRSSEAAKEITQLIKDSTNKVEEGTRLTDRSQDALRKISEGGEVNMRAIEEIARASDLLSESTNEVNNLVTELNKLAEEIVTMAGQQGPRREAAQKALTSLVEKANTIAMQVGEATGKAASVGEEMRGVLQRSDEMKKRTELQAGRSKTLREVTAQSVQHAKQTATGAGEVVGITLEMQRLAANLTRQVAQFKVRKDQIAELTEAVFPEEEK